MNQGNKDPKVDSSKRLNALEKTIEEINKNKKLTVITSYTGIIVIIITLAVFVTSMYSFFNEYNTKLLAEELQARLPSLTESKAANEVYTTIQETVIPQYTKALKKKLNDDAPLFAQDLLKEKENLYLYLQNDVKEKITDNIINELSDSEAHNLALYFKQELPEEKLVKISRTIHDVLQVKLTDELNNLITPVAIEQIHDINDCFETLYTNMHAAGEFDNITPESVGEIENRFIEVILESIIYEINPQKGAKPSSIE